MLGRWGHKSRKRERDSAFLSPWRAWKIEKIVTSMVNSEGVFVPQGYFSSLSSKAVWVVMVNNYCLHLTQLLASRILNVIRSDLGRCEICFWFPQLFNHTLGISFYVSYSKELLFTISHWFTFSSTKVKMWFLGPFDRVTSRWVGQDNNGYNMQCLWAIQFWH